MNEFPVEKEEESLLDLNEIKQAFGIDGWSIIGPGESFSSESLSLLVDIQGQHYVVR